MTLLHKQDGSGELQPRLEYCPIRLLKHSWPHDGKDEIAGKVEVEDVVVVEVLVVLMEVLLVVTEVLVVVAEVLVVVVVVIVEELGEELVTGSHVPHSG